MCFAFYFICMLFLAVIMAGYIHVAKTGDLPHGKQLLAWAIICLIAAPFLPFVVASVVVVWAIVAVIEIVA